MSELLRVIVENLVDDRDSIYIDEHMDDGILVLELKVNSDDVGKVIGKQGKIAKAIRTVVKSSASFNGQKVVVKIM